MRVLLCNPPAPRPTMRDYYCSSTSKAAYVWHPIDLLVQGAWLKDRHTLIWRDFAVTPATREEAWEIVRRDRPDAILGLVGAAARDDFGFWRRAQEESGASLFVSGDLARFAPLDTLAKHDFVAGVVSDFTLPGVRDMLQGKATTPGLWCRNASAPEAPTGDFAYPPPPHDLVWALPYRHPFLPDGFATIMTDHGCVHRCRYCNSGAVGWRGRALDNLEAELHLLARRRRRNLFIKDMTFNADTKRTLAILDLLARTGPWRFACYVRPDRVSDELAAALRRAGCVMAMVGLESGDDNVLRSVRPGATVAAASAGVRRLHAAKVPVGGHFLLGLPGESGAETDKTIAWACRLPLAYASFNLAAPRPGTPLDGGDTGVADGSSPGTLLLADRLSRGELLAKRDAAVRAFYGRPGYLARRLAAALRTGRLRRELRHGWFLWRG